MRNTKRETILCWVALLALLGWADFEWRESIAHASSISQPAIPGTATDIATPTAPTAGSTTYYTKGGLVCGEAPSAAESCLKFSTFASLTAATGNISNTETLVTNVSVPPNTFKAGSMIRVWLAAACTTSTSPGSGTIRVRIGPTTLTGTIIGFLSPTLVANATAKNFVASGYLSLRTIVTTTATIDALAIMWPDTALVAAGTNFGGSVGSTFNPTVTNLVEVTYQSGASTSSCNFSTALIQLVL